MIRNAHATFPAAWCAAALLCTACRVAPEAAGPQAMTEDPR